MNSKIYVVSFTFNDDADQRLKDAYVTANDLQRAIDKTITYFGEDKIKLIGTNIIYFYKDDAKLLRSKINKDSFIID